MLDAKLVWIPDGSVTSPQGFLAGVARAGIKDYADTPRPDLGLLVSHRACAAAGLFTRNRVCGAPVLVSRRHIADRSARAIVANSGCANVATGARGEDDAIRMTSWVGDKLGIPASEVLVASTGVIGRPLPMDAIERALPGIQPSRDGGHELARAIMTTDTVPKTRALRVEHEGRSYTVGGVAKGSGMIHPDMATCFCFLTTDAPVDAEWLHATLREVGDVSLNMLDVDMDTSTSDCMFVLANGAAGGETIDANHSAAWPLHQALERVAIELTRDLARDGEGARTLIEVHVSGAATREDARRAARTVVASPLVKTMVTGRDPNPGRVLMAVGRSGAEVELARLRMWIGDKPAFERGEPARTAYDTLAAAMHHDEVRLSLDLGLGDASATAWGCDLTEEYIRINADYTT